jgi:hypothetical protein
MQNLQKTAQKRHICRKITAVEQAREQIKTGEGAEKSRKSTDDIAERSNIVTTP